MSDDAVDGDRWRAVVAEPLDCPGCGNKTEIVEPGIHWCSRCRTRFDMTRPGECHASKPPGPAFDRARYPGYAPAPRGPTLRQVLVEAIREALGPGPSASPTPTAQPTAPANSPEVAPDPSKGMPPTPSEAPGPSEAAKEPPKVISEKGLTQDERDILQALYLARAFTKARLMSTTEIAQKSGAGNYRGKNLKRPMASLKRKGLVESGGPGSKSGYWLSVRGRELAERIFG